MVQRQIFSIKQLVERVLPEKILDLENIDFLPKNDNPIGRSSSLACIICGELMVSHLVNYLSLSEDPVSKSSRLIGYHNTFEIVKFDVEAVKNCIFCGDPNYVEPLPETVESLSENKEKEENNSINPVEKTVRVEENGVRSELEVVEEIEVEQR